MALYRYGAALAALLVTGACAAGGGAGAGAGTAAGAPGSSHDSVRGRAVAVPAAVARPLGLVGSWQVRAAGEAPGTVLRLGDDLALRSRCGERDGAWRADVSGMFVADTYAFSTRCVRPGSGPNPAWLAEVSGFRRDGAGWRLTGRDGRTAARLLPLTPGTRAGNAPISRELRGSLLPPAPLPAGLRPATGRDLRGRWVPARPVGHPPLSGRQPPYLQLVADGSWRSSDGCNSDAGRWTSGAAGRLLSVGGVSTLIGCAGAPVDGWFIRASSAGFDGRVLVLVDRAGHVTGRLRRG